MTVADDISLTPRQREILTLFIEGRSAVAIARDLGCSHWTVRRHIANIAEKLREDFESIPPVRRVLLYGAALLSEGE